MAAAGGRVHPALRESLPDARVALAPQDIHGESFYNPYLAETLDELERRGLTEISAGALCVFPPGFHNRDGDPLPLIVRKNDGGYSYATTDLATVRHWIGQRDMTDLLYVVGTPQAQHFQMVFAVSQQARWLTDEHDAVHVNFGSMLGEDGRTIRTRAGSRSSWPNSSTRLCSTRKTSSRSAPNWTPKLRAVWHERSVSER